MKILATKTTSRHRSFSNNTATGSTAKSTPTYQLTTLNVLMAPQLFMSVTHSLTLSFRALIMQWLRFFCLGTLLCVDQLSAANAFYIFIHFPPFSPSSFSRSSFFGISLLRERSPETRDEYVFYSLLSFCQRSLFRRESTSTPRSRQELCLPPSNSLCFHTAV